MRSVFCFTSPKKALDLLVGTDVAGKDGRVGAEGPGEFLDVLLEPLALVVENQFRAGAMPCLRDRPGDAAFVGHAEDDAGFAGQGKVAAHGRP